jgi:hypothetical protein
VPLGRKVFLAVVLSQLVSIALILGWYFYTLRSELGSLTQQRALRFRLVAMQDYIQREAARPSFITSLSSLAIQGACRPVCQSNSRLLQHQPESYRKKSERQGAIEKSFESAPT